MQKKVKVIVVKGCAWDEKAVVSEGRVEEREALAYRMGVVGWWNVVKYSRVHVRSMLSCCSMIAI
jgi:hypothetical protein